MKKEIAKCKFCDVEIPGDTCQLAAYTTEVDGKKISFCCQNCAPQEKKVIKK
jgi:hypothetical protein